MKNIIFLIGNMKSGGAERVINNLCNELKNDYNITLVVNTIEDADYIPDVNIVEIKEFLNKLTLPIALFKLHHLKKKLKIDISISFILKYNVYNYLTKYKDKIIFSVRNFESMNKKYVYSKNIVKLYKNIINKADLVVNVSEEVRKDQIDNFNSDPNKNIVIPNFCLVDDIRKNMKKDLPLEHRKIFENKVVISCGRYVIQKAQWHAIRAFKKVVEYDKDVKLVLTGRGPLKDFYIDLIDKLKLNDSVFVLDFVDHRYMYNSYIYLLNSIFEGMPNVILEAMACGLPVISTDSKGGSKEIISDNKTIGTYVDDISLEKYGILIPDCSEEILTTEPLTHEEELLADSIIMLLKDKKLYENYKKMSEKRVKDFSEDKVLKMWKDIL